MAITPVPPEQWAASILTATGFWQSCSGPPSPRMTMSWGRQLLPRGVNFVPNMEGSSASGKGGRSRTSRFAFCPGRIAALITSYMRTPPISAYGSEEVSKHRQVFNSKSRSTWPPFRVSADFLSPPLESAVNSRCRATELWPANSSDEMRSWVPGRRGRGLHRRLEAGLPLHRSGRRKAIK
jgi:hypothetical protein